MHIARSRAWNSRQPVGVIVLSFGYLSAFLMGSGLFIWLFVALQLAWIVFCSFRSKAALECARKELLPTFGDRAEKGEIRI